MLESNTGAHYEACCWCRIKGFAVSDVGLPKRMLSEYRMGNPHDGNIKQDGGWHFGYFMSAADIAQKLGAFGHTEYDRAEYKDLEHLKRCLQEGKDLFNRGLSFDMLPASADRKATYPEGWQAIAKKLAVMQKLPAASPGASRIRQRSPNAHK